MKWISKNGIKFLINKIEINSIEMEVCKVVVDPHKSDFLNLSRIWFHCEWYNWRVGHVVQ